MTGVRSKETGARTKVSSQWMAGALQDYVPGVESLFKEGEKSQDEIREIARKMVLDQWHVEVDDSAFRKPDPPPPISARRPTRRKPGVSANDHKLLYLAGIVAVVGMPLWLAFTGAFDYPADSYGWFFHYQSAATALISALIGVAAIWISQRTLNASQDQVNAIYDQIEADDARGRAEIEDATAAIREHLGEVLQIYGAYWRAIEIELSWAARKKKPSYSPSRQVGVGLPPVESMDWLRPLVGKLPDTRRLRFELVLRHMANVLKERDKIPLVVGDDFGDRAEQAKWALSRLKDAVVEADSELAEVFAEHEAYRWPFSRTPEQWHGVLDRFERDNRLPRDDLS